jgi:hypothetical protein
LEKQGGEGESGGEEGEKTFLAENPWQRDATLNAFSDGSLKV